MPGDRTSLAPYAEGLNRIADYALIGDCHSAALVGRDGSVDWACFPRFDSPAAFCRILDERRGGSFWVRPAGRWSSSRRYREDTNVLVTTFEAERGTAEVTECMPVAPLNEGRPTAVRATRSILRHVRCTDGAIGIVTRVAPRFEYGSFLPRFRLLDATHAEIVGGADAMFVRSTRPLTATTEAIEASWELSAGEEAWIEAEWSPSYSPASSPMPLGIDLASMRTRLAETVEFWRTWMQRSWYDGDWQAQVRRSALVLKALTFAPSGAAVAAPTTSLPECVGGERNWDYRFTWIRDATLMLISLFVLGFTDEADDFKRWLERTGAGRPEDLQIMYGIGGERSLPESVLGHLDGHRRSAPVRIGNAAVKQLQLDSYGQILEAAWLYVKADRQLTETNWTFISGLADIVCDRWRRPDQGIWEIRDHPRHFLHSKANCWVALDRASRIADALDLPGHVDRWRTERDRIRDYLLSHAAREGWFPQAAGADVADASTLLLPAFGLLPGTAPEVTRTVQAVTERLGRDGLLHRYLADDGLEGDEGAFLLCSFWLVDCLAFARRVDDAERLLERLLGLANDVGLLAEEVDPDTGEALGNFPQAFSHMALVQSCANVSAAKRGRLPEGAVDYAEAALDRLLARPGTGRTGGVRDALDKLGS